MEIETATQRTLSALTLSEKSLARSLLFNEQYREVSGAAWLRAPVLKLGDAIAKVRNGAATRNFTARYINLYCDTLIIDTGTRIVPENVKGREVKFSIEIFARNLVFPENSNEGECYVRFTKDSEILFWIPHLLPGLQISYEYSDGTKVLYAPEIVPGSFGVQVQYEDEAQGLTSTELPVPDVAMQNVNYMDLISDDGKLLDKGFRNDDLPRLVQFQMLVAQAHTSINRPLALALLDFIIATTASERGAHIFYQATSLRTNLTIDADIMSVPSVNIYASKQVLKSRLLAAMAFESAFRDFTLELGTRKVQADTALNMLAKSNNAIQTYDFLKAIRQREYDNAVSANDKACQTFERTQAQLETLGAKFQEGIKKWKQDQITSGIKDVLTGIVQVGIAIGTTVATAGVAAPAIAVAAGNVASTASKVAQLIAKLKDVFTRIKAIYEKIKPVIEKLQALVKTIQEVVTALKNFDAVTTGPRTVKPQVLSTDVFNATAEWRRFDIVVREIEKSLEDYKDINGKEEYFRALKFMVVDGETYILTQANLVQKGDELTMVIVQQKMERRDETRLISTAANISDDAAVLDILARAMFDRVLAIRSMVYLDFFTYTEAYRYHTLSNEPIVTLSPVKPVVDYLEDAARLQGAIASFGSIVMVQQRIFRINSLCGFADAQELGSALSAGKSVSINVGVENPVWNGMGRFRLSRARCWFTGVKVESTNAQNPLRIELKTGGRFFDHSLQTPTLDSSTISTTRSFVGAPRRILFEYEPDSKTIICDGVYGQERDYTKQTPITNWSVRWIGDGETAVKSEGVDFSNFEGITLEFLSDFTLKV